MKTFYSLTKTDYTIDFKGLLNLRILSLEIPRHLLILLIKQIVEVKWGLYSLSLKLRVICMGLLNVLARFTFIDVSNQKSHHSYATIRAFKKII
ncbi:hypothetical protein ACMYSN_17845 [Klebsiella sp. R445]